MRSNKLEKVAFKVMSEFSICSPQQDFQYTLYTDEVNFEDAKSSCVASAQTLARISNEAEFNLVVELLDTLESAEITIPNDFWIGKALLKMSWKTSSFYRLVGY